jgi:WhiB family transcriptional regulator, redox-sensing transcriptional regulator
MTSRTRVPVIGAEQLRWQRASACRGRAEFFDDDTDHPPLRHYREARARALCQSCPVRARCAAYALRQREPYGIWGGFTESQRRRLLTVGWRDVADRRGQTVDVAALEKRLH